MDNWTDRFINGENISRFADGFGREVDPERRQVLKDLLVAEEHRLGIRSWHLELVENNIAKVKSLIEKQNSLVSDGLLSGRELRQADLLLANYSDLCKLFEEFRSVVVRALDRGMI